jgi:DNA topoisomerase-2
MTEALCEKYQRKTDKEHVLDNPEPYTGAMELTPYETFLWRESAGAFVSEEISMIPGLYKLFDEAAVNARDHYIRQAKLCATSDGHYPVTRIDFIIGSDGRISVRNNGDGIDVTEHPEHKMYIPELIFGHLRTSSNYNKNEERTGGGRNGLGFKLALIWSTEGTVETVDHTRGLKYVQCFNDNLSKIEKPKITKCKAKPYTSVSFLPDYTRLGINGLSDEMRLVMERRVHDIAAVTPASVKVSLNGKLVQCRTFVEYAKMFQCVSLAGCIAHEKYLTTWEYAICPSDKGQFCQVSMVNGIYTSAGGKHVDFIMSQVIKAIQKSIQTTHKIDVKPSSIKEQLFLFLRCDISDPVFDSQTKDCLMTPPHKFNTKCTVSPKFIKQLIKFGVANVACNITSARDIKKISKFDGAKTSTVTGIPKLVDAHLAGTKSSSRSILLIVEGDSAKAGVISGLSKEHRNVYGVYPLKGKLMNVRGETATRIAANAEIADIKKILGLEVGKDYETQEDISKLRYGRVLFLTDQDKDGTHIKALGVNLLHSEWRSLLLIPNFVGFMSTPIIRATKGSLEQVFYSEQECEDWKASCTDHHNYKLKYYKGLGTSSAKEFKQYFRDQRIVMFSHSGATCDTAINMVFDKALPDARKSWLQAYEPSRILPSDAKEISYKTFMDDDVIHFSKYDCDRSIPNLLDGLKTSQRKTLFGFFKRGNRSEVKVAQMAGYISEHSCYHHGEASLNGTIVGMAQNFVGSNNINLLSPNGQFGTRLQGGKDSASERYIFTQLEKITRLIFRREDESLLPQMDDDGTAVEPEWYAPVIPMILINGARGIGTGFSTFIPPCNPLTIISYIRSQLEGTAPPNLEPYYRGSNCPIIRTGSSKYMCSSIFAKSPSKADSIRITDLCIGTWTDEFKARLEKHIAQPKKTRVVKAYRDDSTDTDVDITVTFVKGKVVLSGMLWKEKMNKLLKLSTSISTSNMHAFDASQKLVKFNTLEQIANQFMERRLELYASRKKSQLERWHELIRYNQSIMQFITLVLEDKIDLRQKEETIMDQLRDEFQIADELHDKMLSLPIRSLTEDNVAALRHKCQKMNKERDELKSMSLKSIWMAELINIEIEYNKSIKTKT